MLSVKGGISVEKENLWIGGLASLFKSGENKAVLKYFTLNREECRKLVQELKKDDVGYLVATPRTIDLLS